jgi:hypothetical protein
MVIFDGYRESSTICNCHNHEPIAVNLKKQEIKMTELKENQTLLDNTSLSRIYAQLGELLKELEKKELPHKITEAINLDIEELNSTSQESKELGKLVKQKQAKIIKMVEKELKIVPKNYYRKIWFVLGMSVFGVPLGVAFGLSIGNLAFLGLGLPLGMSIGVLVGSIMDKKAFEEGRQLNIEIKEYP